MEQESPRYLVHKLSYSRFSVEIYQFLLPWQQGGLAKFRMALFDWSTPKPPVSVVTYALPAFSGQLPSGDKDRLDGLFRKAFKRGLCSDVFHIDDLAHDADTKLLMESGNEFHSVIVLAAKDF